MNHLRKFEDLDYLEQLKRQKELDRQAEEALNKKIEDRRQQMSNKHLDKLSSEVGQSGEMQRNLEERKELTHMVLQSILYSEQKKDGFDNFKDDLKALLNKYSLDKLPPSGSAIYRR